MLKINGVDIATPQKFSVNIEDIDGETERNANGDLLRDRVAVKRKLNCEWPPLKNSEISVLLKAVKDVYFDVFYPDPEEGTSVTKTFYVGPRTAPVYTVDAAGQPLWENLKMDFIER
jgi:hypothetical protein